MGSPDPEIRARPLPIQVSALVPDGGVVLHTQRDRAVEQLAYAMAELVDEVAPEDIIARAGLIVDATLDRAGRPFIVLMEGSEIDARALATAVRSVGTGQAPTDSDVRQAGAAITALVGVIIPR